MRPAAWVAVFVLAVVAPGLGPRAAAATCGLLDYPDADSFREDAVVDAARWDTLVAAGGFDGAVEGQGSVGDNVTGTGRTYSVILEERTVREYIGGEATEATVLALRVEVREGATVRIHNFTVVSAADRAGGNLTLLVRLDGAALDIFWRWAYLPCDESFPNSYYVFHARWEGDLVTEDNTLVYFESPRPRRGPPLDLILLVSAGVAVSVIFLLARRHLKKS